MRFRLLFVLAVLLVLTSPQLALAQKVYRIGGLVPNDQFVASIDGFKKRMAELGYTEGKNVKYDFYNAKGDQDVLKKLAQKLIQDKPDLIVTSSTLATVPIAKASAGTNIPAVFLSAGDPLRFVKSYVSSGNNLTGISTSVIDLVGKRLELLKELAPQVKRIASIHNPKGVNYEAHLTGVRTAAKKLGLKVWEINVIDRKEIEEKTAAITAQKADAIIIEPDINIGDNMDVIVKQSLKEKLPLIPLIPPPLFIGSGGLATYGHNDFGLGQQGAMLVDKILKGAKPSALPIEQPSKMRLIINLKTAKAIGLKVPREILIRADEVIE